MKILIYKNSKQYGPYSVEEVQKWLSSGHLRATDLAYYEGATSWIPLSTVPGISNGSRVAPQMARLLLHLRLRRLPTWQSCLAGQARRKCSARPVAVTGRGSIRP
jgi:hypothetical protein